MSTSSPAPTPVPVTGASAITVITQLVALLAPLDHQEQQKAITAALILLGQSPTLPAIAKAAAPSSTASVPGPSTDDAPAVGISIKGNTWMRKSGISQEQLDHVFAVDSGCEVIASRMPGGSKRQQTVEAYLIAGLQALLQAGEAEFSDQSARAVCAKVGCYDRPNHSNYMKALGNLVSGSKDTGWKLTNPGLGKAAEIVKALTAAAE